MRTKTLANKINFITLGCSKNTVDTEVMMTQLKANAFDVVHEESNSNAGIVVINTCGFIENAKHESIETILNYTKAKKQGKIQKLIVTGCLSHRYKDELEDEIPEVDAFFGTMELPAMLKSLGADYKHELLGERLTTTAQHTSFLKIAEGCNRPCSFCAIPLMRGKHRSKTIEEIIVEVDHLTKNGTKEIVLIAQDLTYYGLDIYDKRALAELLNRIAERKGVEWLRLQYAYPSQFPEDILDVINAHNNICKYLDMPLQHASDNMLKSMRRGITAKRTQELIDKIRSSVPDIALRTTLISGYPGETQADHEALVNFVSDNKFERLGVFTYSHEENTAAFNLRDSVSEALKVERMEEIMAIQQDISYQNNQKFIGSIQKVLIDRIEGNKFIGRTQFDSPEVDNEVVITANDTYLAVGSFVNVKIDAAEDFDLLSTSVVN